MNKRVIIYTRVSTNLQNTEMQLLDLRKYSELRGFEIVAEYSDVASGSKNDRVNYLKMLNDVRKRKADVVLVWRFDRCSRSVKELLNLLDEFRVLGVDFISYNENIDTSTPTGKVLFSIIAAFSEFERNVIRERVVAGIAKAKAEGKILGRPKIKEEVVKRIEYLRSKGIHYSQIIKEVGISRAKYFQVIK